LRSGGIEVVRDWPDDLPAVYGDGDQLHQVLINLLINAQQAMDGQNAPRRITIHLAHDESRDELVIVVADTGPGLPEAIRSRIFEPYFTTKPMGVGTGIGLAVSRGMVEAHGGTLTSLPNDRGKTGARFEIRLPRGGAEPAATTESGAASSALSLPAKRALVIDDEPGIAAMLAELLARDGFACDIAASGEEARRLLESTDVQTRYGAILCDLHMPREDGPTLFRWLQQHRPEAAQRVIFVTGDTLGPNAGRFLAESGRPVVEKPFAPSEIRRIVGAIASGPLGHAGA
jgi:two-component system NtrC family sensor kinase